MLELLPVWITRNAMRGRAKLFKERDWFRYTGTQSFYRERKEIVILLFLILKYFKCFLRAAFSEENQGPSLYFLLVFASKSGTGCIPYQSTSPFHATLVTLSGRYNKSSVLKTSSSVSSRPHSFFGGKNTKDHNFFQIFGGKKTKDHKGKKTYMINKLIS